MDASQRFSSFTCEIRVLQAKNIKFISSRRKNLFVRYYLYAGKNHNPIRLNTRQISSNSDFFWNESFSLECFGTGNSIDALRQATVVFELRRTKMLPFLGGSELMARAEVPWNQVFESSNMVFHKWVSLVSADGSVCEGLKRPELEIGMRVRVAERMEMEKMRRSKECGCKSEMGHCADYDVFAMTAAMEFL